jgi:signal transduction histidine kinase
MKLPEDLNSGSALNPRTLRGRLTLSYASALVVALIAFAALALAVVDAEQRRGLDDQLATTARALNIVGDVVNGELIVDAKDREQFETILGTRAEGAIVSANGALAVASNAAQARSLRAFGTNAAVPKFTTVRAGGEELRAYAEPYLVKDRILGHILTWHDTGVIDQVDRNLAVAFTVAIPIVVGLAILAGGAIAQRGLKPLARIARLASEIEARDLSRRLAPDRQNDELGRLGATFNRMLDRLQNAFERERRFTSDASHELRAPLSVIRAEADLALRKERSVEEYRRALTAIAAEADALEDLTRDLLAAARDEGFVEEEPAPINVCEAALSAADRMSVLASTRQVSVKSRLGEAVFARANRSMLERALIGVLHNAIKYTPQGGAVTVAVARQHNHADLVVTDDGPGFSDEALRHGVERLWRDIEAKAQEGSGLGLSLAKSIVERYGGTIELANAVPHGAIVRMSFPAHAPETADIA